MRRSARRQTQVVKNTHLLVCVRATQPIPMHTRIRRLRRSICVALAAVAFGDTPPCNQPTPDALELLRRILLPGDLPGGCDGKE